MKKQNSKKIRYKITTTVHLILTNSQDELLLLKRRNTGYEDGNYSLIAGHVEENETVLQAIIREAKEEIGIEMDKNKILFHSVLHRRKESVNDEDRIDFFFNYLNFKGVIENKEISKCEGIYWCKFDKLPENLIPFMKIALLNETKKYLEYGWE